MASALNQNSTPEEIIRLDNEQHGLVGVIVIHSTRLGPAAGGCRFWHYAKEGGHVDDALRLAEGMAYKNAMAGLPLGGGKAVIRQPAGSYDRSKLFRAFGLAVEALNGRYITAEDVGTSVEDMNNVAQTTRHVAGLPLKEGNAGGDPSPWTALGVFRAMQVAVEHRLHRSLDGVTVAVQGLGNVGMRLCELVKSAGASLYVSDIRSERVGSAVERFGAKVMASNDLIHCPADVFAPCALGSVLNATSIQHLRAKVVCGAANNQLATPADGHSLWNRGILYAPDYLVNAGGIINAATEYFSGSEFEAQSRVELIGPRLAQVLALAETRSIPPHVAADELALSIMSGTAPDFGQSAKKMHCV